MRLLILICSVLLATSCSHYRGKHRQGGCDHKDHNQCTQQGCDHKDCDHKKCDHKNEDGKHSCQQDHSSHKHSGDMPHSFADADKWAKVFDDPKRDEWQKPGKVVEWMEIKSGMKVADIGAGTGYFLPYLNKVVGTKGSVMALDIEPNLITHMKNRIEKEGLSQTQAFLTDPDNPRLEAKSLDRILIVDTWHHIGDRAAYAKHLKSALKKNGQIYIVDFEPGKPGVGPDDRHRMPPDKVMAELAAAGLQAKVLKTEDLHYQYIVVARP
ncbi:MAG: class I SAM-dependent methyltransferase [Bdellovibrionales bacterium]|nr:class I SAM-dependent methyltransferase [Bdellovibrionales bacterium]